MTTTRASKPTPRPDLRLAPGVIAKTIGRLSVDATGAWIRLLAALDAGPDDDDDGLLDDDHALAALCDLNVGAWRRARRELEWRGAVSSDGRSVDERGCVVHPGWLRLTLFSDLTASARARSERRGRAGSKGASARWLRVVSTDDASVNDGNATAARADGDGNASAQDDVQDGNAIEITDEKRGNAQPST